jgi:RNA polymerase sigma factor (sigma-70 family)
MSEKIRVVLADDHIVVLEGLRGLLEQEEDIQVVALVQNGDELLVCLEKSEADVVVLDLEMPYHGLTALEEIRKREIPVRVVVLTAFGDGSSIQSALELRAEGFALKTESPIQLIEAIRQVAQGRLIFPAAAQRWLMNQARQEANKSFNELSPREWEVIACTAKGMTNPEIAKSLGVSANTVRFHLKSIFGKIQVTNRTEAAAWYFAHKGGQ